VVNGHLVFLLCLSDFEVTKICVSR